MCIQVQTELSSCQVEARQATRFNSMLQEYYSGRRAYQTLLSMGCFVDVRLPQFTACFGSAPTDAAATTAAKCRGEKDKYYSSLRKDLVFGEQPANRSTQMRSTFYKR